MAQRTRIDEEKLFNLLMNPPKALKCRIIMMALHSISHPTVSLEMFPETRGDVKSMMRNTLKRIDPLYETALAVLAEGQDRTAMSVLKPPWYRSKAAQVSSR